MKNYAVQYSTTTSYDTVVKANSAKEAKSRVIEVIGQSVKIETIYELTKEIQNA